MIIIASFKKRCLRAACPRFFHGWLGRSRRKLEKKHREKDLAKGYLGFRKQQDEVHRKMIHPLCHG